MGRLRPRFTRTMWEPVPWRGAGATAPLGAAATLAHTAGYLLVCGIVAAIVYWRFGLRWLRRGWVNLDAVWAGALVVTAALTVL